MNNCIFLGRITKEPTIRNTQNGGIVYSNSIAIKRQFKSEEDAEADFINIISFGKIAEFMQKYMSNKGQQILVETHLKNRNWEDENGLKHYATDFIVDRCYFADSKREDNQISNTEPQQNFDATPFVNSNDDLPF